MAYEDWAFPAICILIALMIFAYIGWKKSSPKEYKLKKIIIGKSQAWQK